MNLIEQQKEWDFICCETVRFARSNKSVLMRELLFVAQNLLTLYCSTVEDARKVFIASTYLITKEQYLKGT